jgi:hypothetical protein
MRIIIISVMALMATACNQTNPNENEYLHGSTLGFGGLAEGPYAGGVPYDQFVLGGTGLTDTHCAYVWSYDYLPYSGPVQVTVSASNNAAGCFAIGTYTCTFTPSDPSCDYGHFMSRTDGNHA